MCTYAYRQALLRELSSVPSSTVSLSAEEAESDRLAEACSSVVEVETVQVGSRQPLMSPRGQVHS
jgi:hypothetical protein